MDLRPQCVACPWRNLDWMRSDPVGSRALAAAERGDNGFVCHTRCGPCDGPSHAHLLGTVVVS